MSVATSKRYRTIWAAGTVAVVLGTLLALKLASEHVHTLSAAASSRLPGMLRTQPPWTRNTRDLGMRLETLGLPPVGDLEHDHVSLTIFVRGRRIAVPVGVGLSPDAEAPLHVHAGEAGIVHVESMLPFWRATLGEFFDVWGVRFSSRCLGSYCAAEDAGISIYVDGRKASGNPRLVPLRDHENIAVVFGTPAEQPTSFPEFDWSDFG
jgi:hypothetical protein